MITSCALIVLTVVLGGCSQEEGNAPATAARLLEVIKTQPEEAKRVYRQIPESSKNKVRRELALLLAEADGDFASVLWAETVHRVGIPFTEAEYQAAFKAGTPGSRAGMLIQVKRQIADWDFYIDQVQHNSDLDEQTIGVVLQYVPQKAVATWTAQRKQDLLVVIERLLQSEDARIRVRGLQAAARVYTLTPQESTELNRLPTTDATAWLRRGLPELSQRVPDSADHEPVRDDIRRPFY